MKLSVDQLKTLFAPGSYLDHRKRNLVAQCPQCGEKEFGISLDDNHQFGCYRQAKCGFRGNIITLLKFLGRTDFHINTRHETLDKVDNVLEKQTVTEELELTLPACSLPLMWKRVYDNPYLNQRGFTQDDYNQYEVGVTNIDPRFDKGYVIFPVREEGEVKGYVGRCILSKKTIDAYNRKMKLKGEKDKTIKRYKNSSSDFSKMSYGFEDIIKGVTKTLIIVEGIFDKINVDKLLNLRYRCDTKCVATFKCNCSEEQIFKWMLQGIENVIILYDIDVIAKTKEIALDLEKYFTVQVGYVDIVVRQEDEKGGFVEERGDVGDANLQQLEAIMENLVYPSSFTIDKVNIKKLDL